MSRPDWMLLPEHWMPPVLPSPGVHRRAFLKLLGAAGAGAAFLGFGLAAGEASAATLSSVDFPDGVKCGDPQPDGAVIWTRVPAPPGAGLVRVVWMVAEDAAMTRVVTGGLVFVDDRTGHAAKLRVRRLRPDRWYHYAFFLANGAQSVVGRLRTAPAPDATPDRLRYAFASCQQRGVRGISGAPSLYVTHRAIANEGVDFLMHLGDYIYVSDDGDLRLPQYRRRWRIFHSNPLLQELQAKLPLVAMWDDGEFYNGVDRTGDPLRLADAKRAFFEHMPLFAGPNQRAHRAFSWGRLADVVMIDVRSHRDPEIPSNTNLLGALDAQDTRFPPCDQMFAPGRTTLGAEQKRWLEDVLVASPGTWRLIGNPYNMSPWKITDLDTPEARAADPNLQRNGGIYVSNEAWDDYAAERREILDLLVARNVGNVIFTSGHTHFYLASELMPDYDDAASPVAAFDFVTGSQTADPDPRTRAPEFLWSAIEQAFLANNAPYMRHANLLDQGYAVVDVTPDETIVEFRVVDTFDPNAVAQTGARFRVRNAASRIEVLSAPRGTSA